MRRRLDIVGTDVSKDRVTSLFSAEQMFAKQFLFDGDILVLYGFEI
jgi:hypothetical protein